MDMPDPTAVREDATWLSRHGIHRSEIVAAKAKVVADAYLALTDSTPLTVEVLVGMGLDRVGCYYSRGELMATAYKDGSLEWTYKGEPVQFPPRTAGELAQLLMRMK